MQGAVRIKKRARYTKGQTKCDVMVGWRSMRGASDGVALAVPDVCCAGAR
jgi:hypothetical protein